MNEKVTGDSFVFSTIPESPERQKLRRLVNKARDAAAAGQVDKAAALATEIQNELRQLSELPADHYPDWRWDLCGMQSWAASTFERYEEAIDWERKGLAIATRDDQRARNFNNLSDHCVRLGRYDEAVAHARQAFLLWPSNEGIICNLALALTKAGHVHDGAALLAELAAGTDIRDKRSILAAHLKHEKQLRAELRGIVVALDGESLTQ